MRPTLQPLQPTHAPAPLAVRAATASRPRLLVLLLIVVAACAFALLASAPSDAPATPLQDKQARAAELDRQVAKYEHEYDELQERHRGALIELRRLQRSVALARVEVRSSRRSLGVARVRLTDRAVAIYQVGGDSSQVVELATAGSFSDFFERMETVQRVGQQDADVLAEVRALKQRVEREERQLRAARDEAAVVVERARRDKAKMGSLLAGRQAALNSVNAEIRTLMQAQRRARSAAAARAARATTETVDMTPSASASSSDSSSSIPLPPGSSVAAAAASIAMGKLGAPYVWAGSGPDVFDCSGLVMWAFAQAGRPGLPHSSYAFATMGVDVPLDQVQAGDLVFGSGDGHVGIAISGSSFVHAPNSGDVVKVTSFSDYPPTHARRI